MNVSQLISVSLFSLTAILSFCVWAFGASAFPNEPTMYAGCAVVFLGLGGMALLPSHPLPRKRALAFCLSFAAAFLAYAVIWSVVWFTLPNTFGEMIGASAGLLSFALIFVRWNRLSVSLLVATSVLFLFHTLGYYLGGFAYQAIQGKGPLPLDLELSPHSIRLFARLSWGVGYGLGLGIGLVKLLHLSRHSSVSPSTQI